MNQGKYNVVGVMSGTSLDGVDLAHIQFTIRNNKWEYTIIENDTIEYSAVWINRLQSAIHFSELELTNINIEYTKLLAEIISNFIEKYNITNLDAVCSHGHTILHQPEKGITLQIGNLPQIAKLINQTVVCDFRVQDVKLGGQGAPLVPIGDQILFSDYEYCLNLGGFSNISFQEKETRIAFDISPVNTVLNYYANQLGLKYDNKGQISRSGKINSNLLESLNALEFYRLKHPKSLGFEFVKETIIPLMESFENTIENKLCTFTEHIAIQIAMALPTNKKGQILITGGGAYNDFLIERIRYHVPEMEISIPSPKVLEFKEALIFGLLGVLRIRNEINVLSSVTGAIENHSSGIIYNP